MGESTAVSRLELENYLSELLPSDRIKDYCPNGLQVQGKPKISKLIMGVTASAALIHAAIEKKADAILVHHGIYWKGDDPRCVGMLHGRLKPLIEHDINLFAYHLPLDVHPQLGNNVQLAHQLNWQVEGRIKAGGIEDLVWYGKTSHQSVAGLAAELSKKLDREPLVIGEFGGPVSRVAWCTGAAHRYLDLAKAVEADVFVTGEASESTFHLSQELGVSCIIAGHHATERYGVQAVGRELSSAFGIEAEYLEIENPI